MLRRSMVRTGTASVYSGAGGFGLTTRTAERESGGTKTSFEHVCGGLFLDQSSAKWFVGMNLWTIGMFFSCFRRPTDWGMGPSCLPKEGRCPVLWLTGCGPDWVSGL